MAFGDFAGFLAIVILSGTSTVIKFDIRCQTHATHVSVEAQRLHRVGIIVRAEDCVTHVGVLASVRVYLIRPGQFGVLNSFTRGLRSGLRYRDDLKISALIDLLDEHG